MNLDKVRTVTVWDPLVRVFHGLLVAAFFIAYFTEDELLNVHVWAGYTVGCIVVLRVVWGFVGPKHARFSDFIFGPWKVLGYLLAMIRFRAERYMGHNPAGGAMVVALLIGLAATVWSGLETYAIEENAGPLAGAMVVMRADAGTSPSAPVRLASEEGEDEGLEGSERRNEGGAEDNFWEEVHEVLANLMLVLVIAHILGVFLASVEHRENLVRAMVTGRKRAE